MSWIRSTFFIKARHPVWFLPSDIYRLLVSSCMTMCAPESQVRTALRYEEADTLKIFYGCVNVNHKVQAVLSTNRRKPQLITWIKILLKCYRNC